jgi:hypothetical protein
MRSHDASLPASDAAPAEAGPDAIPWVVSGLASGILGAASVALFFLLLDFRAGKPLWTPTTLGAALFRGEMLSSSAPIEPVLVAGYSAVHGLVFLGFGLIAAFYLTTMAQALSVRRAVVLGVALFLAFELSFVIFALLFERQLLDELGAGWVALANALAAAVMAGFLARRDASARRRLDPA